MIGFWCGSLEWELIYSHVAFMTFSLAKTNSSFSSFFKPLPSASSDLDTSAHMFLLLDRNPPPSPPPSHTIYYSSNSSLDLCVSFFLYLNSLLLLYKLVCKIRKIKGHKNYGPCFCISFFFFLNIFFDMEKTQKRGSLCQYFCPKECSIIYYYYYYI